MASAQTGIIFTNMFTRKIKNIIARHSSENYCRFLRKSGVVVGKNTHFDSKTCKIDLTRPSLIKIGSNCFFNEDFTLLTHDWVTNVFLNTGRQFLNSSGRVTIGDNVSFGQRVTVLKGVTIGDNCFIGAGSVVTKDIPSNSVAVGVPCRVISTLDEYYEKRCVQSEIEALEYARTIKERFGREPVPADFWEEFIWFVDGDKISGFPEIPIEKQLSAAGSDDAFDAYRENHTAKYRSFDDFINAAEDFGKDKDIQ